MTLLEVTSATEENTNIKLNVNDYFKEPTAFAYEIADRLNGNSVLHVVTGVIWFFHRNDCQYMEIYNCGLFFQEKSCFWIEVLFFVQLESFLLRQTWFCQVLSPLKMRSLVSNPSLWYYLPKMVKNWRKALKVMQLREAFFHLHKANWKLTTAQGGDPQCQNNRNEWLTVDKHYGHKKYLIYFNLGPQMSKGGTQ